jgi:GNAT superfamily N-acetyltransferase
LRTTPALVSTRREKRSADRNDVLLRSDLFTALITDRNDTGWFVDLETLGVLSVPLIEAAAPGPPVQDTPERYVRVPTLSTEDQRDHARSVLAEALGAEAAEQLTAPSDWWQRFRKVAPLEAIDALYNARAGWVRERGRSWLRDQGLPEHRFVRVRRSEPEAEPKAELPAARSDSKPQEWIRRDRVALRAALHRAIDLMSEEELSHIDVPDRFFVTIRRATPEDGPAYVALVRALAEFEKLPGPTEEAAARLVADALGPDRKYEIMVAELNGEVVAYAATFMTYSTFLAKPGLYLEDIFVHPKARSQGIATAMITRLKALAQERGCGRFEWTVLDWNTTAQRLYDHLGAERLAQWLHYRFTL